MDAIIDAWLALDPDPATREALCELRRTGRDDILVDLFSGRIGFGTAGLRALMGPGPTRMNRLVIQQSTVGLGHYVLSHRPDPPNQLAVVGFDGRHLSRVFAEDTARVLCALGFVVHLFDQEIPTPVAGFAVQRLGASIGVVITASHNPPGYNGYKVYWHNGAQIIAPHDTGIACAIEAASKQPLPALAPLATLRRSGQVVALHRPMEAAYMDAIFALFDAQPKAHDTPLSVAYSPLHGVGGRFADEAVARMPGICMYTVEAQRIPDGDFPTVRFPNPEELGAMDQVLSLAAERNVDIALANDPDADRLALALRMADGQYRMLSGDELGALLGDDRLQQAKPGDVVATTIVSSRLLSKMAQAQGVAYFETLTGFKWIANGAIARKARGQRLIFGYEEALGYILGGLVWDKDGISALVAVCQLAQRLKSQNTNMLARLEALYRQHGLHVTQQHTLAIDAKHQGCRLGTLLRAQPPSSIDARAVLRIDDLLQTDAFAGPERAQTEPEPLPKSDVLIYTLAGHARIIVRPSGTEPKLKCYYEVCAPLGQDADFYEARTLLTDVLNRLCANHQLQLQALLTAHTHEAAYAQSRLPQTGR